MNLPLLFLILGVAQKEDQEWEKFKLSYNKRYDSVVEEAYRKAIFIKNLQKINDHNQNYEQGLETFSNAINEFSDLGTDEFTNHLENKG